MIRRKLHILYALLAAWIVGLSSAALAAPLAVSNASFEAPDLTTGGPTWSNDLSASSWTLGSETAGNAFIEFIDGFSAEGVQHIGLQGNDYIYQDTGIPVEPNTTYTLVVGVGNRDAGNSPAGALAIVGLANAVPDAANANDAAAALAASVSVDSGPPQAAGTYVDAKLTFTTGAEVDGNVVIFLGDDVSAGRAHFDNVRLDATPSYVVTKAIGSIVLDGDLSDWAGAETIVNPEFSIPEGATPFGDRVTHEPFGSGTWDGLDDHAVTAMAVYDDENLYLALVVTDDYHEHAAAPAWNGDSAQFLLSNAARDTQVALYNYAMGGVDDALTDLIVNHESRPEGVPDTTAAITRDGTTTTYEICVPKAAAGIADLVEGAQFGLAVSVNDGDQATPGQSGWSGINTGGLVRNKNPELAALFTLAGPPNLAEGLVNYWSFDGDLTDLAHGAPGTASSVADDGTFDGANGTDGISYADGAYGDSIELNGATGDNQNDGYVRIPRSDDTLFGANATNPDAPNTVTTSLWVKVTGNDTNWQTMLSHGEGNQYRFARRAATVTNAAYAGGSGDIPNADGVGPNLSDEGWHHVVGISEGGVSTRLWVDGMLVATGDAPTIDDARAEGALDLFIGGNPDTGDQNREWFGGIDEVAQWNRALSNAEIATIYTAGQSLGDIVTPKGTPLIACWTFDGTPDDDVAGIAGTPSEGLVYSSDSVRGQALSTGFINVADTAVFNEATAGDKFSVSLWQKTPAPVNASSFWFSAPSVNGGARGFQAHLPWGNGTIFMDTAGCCAANQRVSGNPTDFNGFAWDDGTYHHFTFVKDGADRRIYIDGEFWIGGGDAAPLPTDIDRLWIGSQIDGAAPTPALMDDFAVWGGALTEDEIVLLAGGADPKTLGEPGISKPAATAEWIAGLDADGNGVWESSNAAYQAILEAPTSPVKGASNFEGVDAWYAAPSATVRSFDAINNPATLLNTSFEIVFRPGDLEGNHVLFETGGNGFGTGFFLQGDSLEYRVQSANSDARRVILSATLPSASVFYQAVATVDVGPAGENGVKLYLNGVEVASGVAEGELNDWAGGDNGGFGRLQGSVPTGQNDFVPFTGDFAIFRYWIDTILDTDSVANLYACLSLPAPQIDGDLDGLLDTWEVANFGDLRARPEGDNDEDGFTNRQEFRNGTNPLVADTDEDGLTDSEEYALGIDPTNPDTDGDGLTDSEEVAAGTWPGQSDTDGDGFADGAEVAAGSDPLLRLSVPVFPTITELSVRSVDAESVGDLAGFIAGPLADGSSIISEVTVVAGNINYNDAGTDAIPGDRPYPVYGVKGGHDFTGLVGTGTFTVPTAGFWTFRTRSDDGSILNVNGTTVIDDATNHGTRNRFGAIELTAGEHTFEYLFYEQGGGSACELAVALVAGDHTDGTTMSPTSTSPHYVLFNNPDFVLADSARDFAETGGIQGAKGWEYGYQVGADGTFGDFTQFPADWWTGTVWDEPNVDGNSVPWTMISAGGVHPNGDNNDLEGDFEDIHQVTRRWVSSHAGEVAISWTLAKENVGGGNGVTGGVAVNGQTIDSATIAFDDGAGVARTVHAMVNYGDTVDLFQNSLGTDGTLADGNDGSLNSMQIAAVVPNANGLCQEWWQNGNPGNRAGLEEVFNARPAANNFKGAAGTWWTGNGGGIPGVQGYPAETTLGRDNYITRLTGQILFPEDGVYKFKDGIDDYTFLYIDLNGNGEEDEGEVLIDDNTWTGTQGDQNGGSPIVEATATAGWVDIVMYTGEGGGGDAGVLYWDYSADGGIGSAVGFPDAQTTAIDVAANGAGLIVPDSNLRCDVVLPGDCDGDGILDSLEIAWFGDLSQDLNDDSDGDRATNADEIALNTNPSIKDTDGDGLWDGEEWIEVALGTLPSVADTDGDGISDGTELRVTGTDPNNPDTDGDGLTDGFELANSCLYSQNFNHLADGTIELGDGSIVSSADPFASAVIGKALQMTADGIGSQNAAYRLPNLGDIGGDFAVAFDYALAGGGARPADGFSFNFGAIADDEFANPAEEGFGKGLTVSFDTWDNNGDEDGLGNGIGIDVRLDGATIAGARAEAGADPTNNEFFVFDGSSHKVEIISESKPESGLPSPLSLFKLDFGNTPDSPGPANGTADGWDGIDNLAMDTAVGVTDQNGVVTGVTITALDDGFNPNNSGAPGAGASFDGVTIPQNVNDDYLFKIDDTAGTSARIRVDGLAGGVYHVTLFEGRTTDTNQVATVWAGSEADDPAAANTDSFANGGATVSVLVTAGDSLFYKHLEDNSGGISGMIIRQFSATESAPELEMGAVAFYNFEQANTGTVSDWSGNGNDGTVVNNVNIVIGGAPKGSSRESAGRFSVDGAGHLDVPGIDMVALAQGDASYSFSAWIKPDAQSIGGDHFIFGQTAQGVHHGLRGDGTLHTAHWGADHNAATVLTADEWIHAVWTYDGAADKAKIYLNGVEDLDADQRAPNGSGNLVLGGRNNGEANFIGDLDDVAIFDRVLTPAEALTLAAVAPAPELALNPVAFYNFEEGDATTVSDLSGNGNDGTVVNNVTVVAGGAPNGSSSRSAGRFSVDGAGHLDVPGIDMVALAQGDASYSFSAWIKPDAESIGGDHFIFGQTAQGVHHGLRGDGTLHTAHWGADNNAATILTANEWIHAVWTYDGAADKAKIYLNGVEDLDADQGAPNGSGNLVIGGRNNGEANFIGDLDDIAVFDRVLTPAEAQMIATAGIEQVFQTVSVKVDGALVHDRVVVDFDPTDADRIAFAARTGGATEDLRLDNICVISGTELPSSPSNPLIADPDGILRDPLLAASNTVFGGQLGDDGFTLGVEGTAGDTNNWPGGEAPNFAIDGLGEKYLNFGKFNTGIIVIPAAPSVASAIKVWAANDEVGRDPSSYEVYGSNADLSGAAGTVPASSFTLIGSGDLALPETRNLVGDLLEENSDFAMFGNTASYAAYMVVFPTIKDEGQNSMQLADVQLLGTMDPVVMELLAQDRDSDGDGITDNAELVSGTNPYDSREFFHVSGISSGLSSDGNRTLLIDLATVPDQTYVLQFSPTMQPGTWENVDVITAEQPSSAFEIMNPQAFQRRAGFFRSILVEQN